MQTAQSNASERNAPRTSFVDTGFAPGTQIGYSAGLIPKLVDDHKEILALYTAIAVACASDKGTGIAPALLAFSRALNSHLVLENTRLYVYMQRSLKNDQERRASITAFRKEMNSIAQFVTDFVTTHVAIKAWSPDLLSAFKKELLTMGDVLITRIESEESALYNHYLPVHAYRPD